MRSRPLISKSVNLRDAMGTGAILVHRRRYDRNCAKSLAQRLLGRTG